VNAQLRPGADASRADAELAAARTQGIQAQQAADVARATLSQFVGMAPGQVTLDVSGLVQLPAEREIPALDAAQNVRKLPPQVVSVLNSGVQSLTASGRV